MTSKISFLKTVFYGVAKMLRQHPKAAVMTAIALAAMWHTTRSRDTNTCVPIRMLEEANTAQQTPATATAQRTEALVVAPETNPEDVMGNATPHSTTEQAAPEVVHLAPAAAEHQDTTPDQATVVLGEALKLDDMDIYSPEAPLATQATAIRDWLQNPEHQHLIERVPYINLSGKNLSRLPAELTRFTNLQRLCLADNRLTRVDEISGLTNLVLLDLSNNHIEALDLFNLSHLQELYASGNRLQALDLSGQACCKLRIVHVSENALTRINVAGLTSLTVLDISNNQLTRVDNLRHLQQIGQLYLQENRLAQVDSLSHLVTLSILDVSHNPLGLIENLPSSLTMLFAQRTLLVSINLENLPRLQVLDVSHNDLDHLEVSHLEQLQMLLIDDNNLKNVLVAPLSKLDTLHAFNNPLEELDLSACKRLKYLKTSTTTLVVGSHLAFQTTLSQVKKMPLFKDILSEEDLKKPAVEQLECLAKYAQTQITPDQFRAIEGKYRHEALFSVSFFSDLAVQRATNQDEALLWLVGFLGLNSQIDILSDQPLADKAAAIRQWLKDPDHAQRVATNMTMLQKRVKGKAPAGLNTALEPFSIALPMSFNS